MIVQRFMFVCSTFLLIFNGFASSEDFNVSSAEPLVANLQNHRQHFDERELIEKKDDKVFNIDPNVVTNSHRPQFYGVVQENQEYMNRDTLDRIDISKPEDHYEIEDNESFDNFDETIDESDNVAIEDEEEYKPSNHLQNKQNHLKNILVKLLEKSDQKRKFAEVIPILKVLTPTQRLVMASLVSKQLMADAKNPPLTLNQVKAMFGNNENMTSELMLPIMLDIANIFRSAKDHYRSEELKMAPQAQLLRRSFNGDEEDDIESMMADHFRMNEESEKLLPAKAPEAKGMKIAAKIPAIIKNSNVKVGSNLKVGNGDEIDNDDGEEDDLEAVEDNDEAEVIKGNVTVPKPDHLTVVYPANQTNLDLNGTILEDMPTAEKLRALNRFIDRNGNIIVVRRPGWEHELIKSTLGQGPLNRKTINDILMAQRRRMQQPSRNTLIEMAKHKCDMFTNSLCLKSVDYPEDAITASIRRNQGAVNALLADFPEVSADSAIDGISSKQENKYTAEHYINNMNRREDGQPATASGFMCPSTIKYARPQKARATSGQWKFIVNTGEHTQTLRLEKCLRPREPCTYLTDNFKSKCVQVYNYHRLLTWDQQNGLHMDIFKVPTCCSCHIEGYSVAFPPHIGKPSESPLEHFPGEDLHDSDINPFEEVQSSIRHSTHAKIPSPLDTYTTLGETHNLIPGSSFNHPAFTEENSMLHEFKQFPILNQFDVNGGNFHTDIFQHQSSNIRNVKKPARAPTNNVGLPSFLEPPSKPAIPLHNTFNKPEFPAKTKPFGNPHFKRGVQGSQNPAAPKRPSRRPIRKKNSNVVEDQMVGATSVHENPTIINMNTFEDINKSADKYERTSTVRSTPMIYRTSTLRPEASSSKITIKNVSPTTERYRVNKYKTTTERTTTTSKDIQPNRRVNYNYHPIIDFFEETSNKKDQASDRMDSGTVYFSGEDDWRPMANPIALPLKGSPDETNSG